MAEELLPHKTKSSSRQHCLHQLVHFDDDLISLSSSLDSLVRKVIPLNEQFDLGFWYYQLTIQKDSYLIKLYKSARSLL